MTTTAVARVSVADVESAADLLDGVAHRTPVITCTALDALTGGQILAKAENLQRTGSFKFRGAYVAASARLREGARGVVAYSSGNHAAAVARSAALLGMSATVLMPADAPASKVRAATSFGAEVRTYDRYTEDRVALARALSEATGHPLIASADDPHVVAGQGTVALELLLAAAFDVLVLPVGGGGLLAGCITALEGTDVQVIGVEPAGSDDLVRSLASGRRETVPVGSSLADGLQLASVAPLAWDIVRDRVADVVTVTEDDIRTALDFVHDRMKLVVEPSAVVGIAALLSGRVAARGLRVATVLTGGNVGNDRLADLLSTTPTEARA